MHSMFFPNNTNCLDCWVDPIGRGLRFSSFQCKQQGFFCVVVAYTCALMVMKIGHAFPPSMHNSVQPPCCRRQNVSTSAGFFAAAGLHCIIFSKEAGWKGSQNAAAVFLQLHLAVEGTENVRDLPLFLESAHESTDVFFPLSFWTKYSFISRFSRRNEFPEPIKCQQQNTLAR